MIALIALGVLVAALWALGPILHKIVLMRGISATSIIIIGGIFSILFGVVCIAFKRHELVSDFEKLELDVVVLLAIVALFSSVLASFIFLYLIDNYESYLVNAVVFTSPIFTLMFAFWILGEEITWLSIVGVVIITIGVIVTLVSSTPKEAAAGAQLVPSNAKMT